MLATALTSTNEIQSRHPSAFAPLAITKRVGKRIGGHIRHLRHLTDLRHFLDNQRWRLMVQQHQMDVCLPV